MTTLETRPVNYRELMKKVEQVAGAIDRADDVGSTIRTVMESLITQFRGELGILGGRLYRRQGRRYQLESVFGEAKPAPIGLEVLRSYPPIRRVLEEGSVFMTPEEPGIDPQFEEQIGAREFAAVEVGDEEFILAFDVAASPNRDDVLFSLGILRHLQIGPEGRECPVGAGQLGGDAVCEGVRLAAVVAEAAHGDVDLPPHGRDELGDVHTGSSIDFWWVFPGKKINSHVTKLVQVWGCL